MDVSLLADVPVSEANTNFLEDGRQNYFVRMWLVGVVESTRDRKFKRLKDWNIYKVDSEWKKKKNLSYEKKNAFNLKT